MTLMDAYRELHALRCRASSGRAPWTRLVLGAHGSYANR